MSRTFIFWGIVAAVASGVASSMSHFDQENQRRQLDVPAASDFLRRSGHDMVVVNDHLYIYGGNINQNVNVHVDEPRPVNQTLSIDLTQSWSNSTVKIKPLAAAVAVTYERVGLWPDPNPSRSDFFIFGGDSDLNGPLQDGTPRFLHFQVSSDGNGNISTIAPPIDTSDVFYSLQGMGSPAATSCADLGLLSGSYANRNTTRRDGTYTNPVAGLITYDAKTQTWANESTSRFAPYFLFGEMACLAFNQGNGIAVFLGGFTVPQYIDLGNNAAGMQSLSLSNLTFYDAASKSWFWQTTTGGPPGGRGYFCAVAVQSTTSTEIFLYGGWDGEDSDKLYSDVWVLTVPGFHWFQGPAGTSRYGHRCVVAGKRQMISLGGLSSVADWYTPDVWAQGIGVLDLTALSWNSSYNALTDVYNSPQVVQEWYDAGNLNSVDWSSEEVRNIFLFQAPINSTQTASNASVPVGAIAGGAVGGVAVLALGVLALYLFFRRKRRRRALQQTDDAPGQDAQEVDANQTRLEADSNAIAEAAADSSPRGDQGGAPGGRGEEAVLKAEADARDSAIHEAPDEARDGGARHELPGDTERAKDTRDEAKVLGTGSTIIARPGGSGEIEVAENMEEASRWTRPRADLFEKVASKSEQ